MADQSTFAAEAMQYAPQLYSAALRMTRNEADVLFDCQCRNNGGQIVEVKDFATTISVPQLNQQPENGQITNSIGASLADAEIPSANEVCPNGKWDIVNPQLAFAGGFQLYAVVSSGNASETIYSEYAQ